MSKYLIFYLILINIVTFISMYIDKQKAIKNKWRTRESTLIILSVMGGSIGMLMGMNTFRHKTKHKKFTIGVPAILITEIILFIYCYFN